MSAYGRTPLSEENGVGLGIAYVELETDANGVIQAANRRYWNHATKVYEPGPRDDAKHVKPCQRLADDPADFDNFVQVVAVERQAVEGFNVVIVFYTLNSSGQVTGVYRTYPHNIAVALGAVNGLPY